MKEEDILRIQNELMQGIDNEQKLEEMVIDMSKEIAAKLVFSDKTTAEIDGVNYMFSYKNIQQGKQRGIRMIVANMIQYQIVGDNYIPYIVNAEIDNDFTLKENLESIIEAFIRHVLDMVKVEEI